MTSAAFIFGDVHGDSVRLKTLIAMAKNASLFHGVSHLQFYSLGDLIDRGPDSKGVVQICIDEQILGIMGNHEQWLWEMCSTGIFDKMALTKVIGGGPTLHSYGIKSTDPVRIQEDLLEKIPKAHQEFILALPFWRSLKLGSQTYRLIHGGLKKVDANKVLPLMKKNLAERGTLSSIGEDQMGDFLLEIISRANPAVLLWTGPSPGKGEDLHEFSDGSVQVFGHVPWPGGAKIGPYWIALDTGCGSRPPFRLSGILLVEDSPPKLLTC